MGYKVWLDWEVEIQDAESEDDAIEKYQKLLKEHLRSGGPFDCYRIKDLGDPGETKHE